ncbi:MAG: 4-alpha-glucanotransferase [Candidatus Eiseniibacteriota bacterium]
MKLERSSGVLLHPSSLPGPHGIGDLGPEAVRWLDFVAASGSRVWQVLPLGPTGFGDSPYQSFSSFAGSPALVSPERLVEDGLLTASDLSGTGRGRPLPASHVDYARAQSRKRALLDRAFERFEAGAHGAGDLGQAFETFWTRNASWLDDFALFMALKDAHDGAPWTDWPPPLRARNATALAEANRVHERLRVRHAFAQFLFFRQWNALRERAHERGIRILGDVPIFVAHDSVDVWANPELFELDTAGRPTAVAGVPPDYYSKTGQLWGNPLYRWDVLAARGFDWWIERVRAATALYDLVRLDHFRGFVAYWEVPANASTAETGRWVRGPGESLFTALRARLGSLPLIAEDLGDITPDVLELRDRLGLPGMEVLQFAFSGPENTFLPHRHTRDSVVYTSTHDNDTAEGWFRTAPRADREFLRRYRGPGSGSVAWDLIRMAWASVAALAIAPAQDLLGLGSAARMNFPGRTRGNWTWRLPPGAPGARVRGRLRELNATYQRG